MEHFNKFKPPQFYQPFAPIENNTAEEVPSDELENVEQNINDTGVENTDESQLAPYSSMSPLFEESDDEL